MNRSFFIFLFATLSSLEAAPRLGDTMQGGRRPFKCSELSKPKKSEVFFNANILIWDAREEGLEYAYKNTGSFSDQELSSLEPESKFEPAFRFELGGFLPYDSWRLGATYTFYRTTRTSSGSLSFDTSGILGPGMIPVWIYPSAFSNNNNGARFEFAKSSWRLHSSFLDLALSRPCAIASYFVMTPSFGLRSALIHQRYETNYGSGNVIDFGMGGHVTPLSSGINMYCNSSNIGLLFGSGFKWMLHSCLDLFTDFSASLLASHFHVKRGEIDLFLNTIDTLETELIHLTNEYWSFRPQAQLSLGLRFSYPFRSGCRQLCYRMSAAYEAEMWWKQNQLLRYIDVQNTSSSGANTAPTQGDLMFHGVNIQFGLDF